MVDDFSFSLENLFDQAPTKRANTILYLIENRVAQQAAQSRQAAIPRLTEAPDAEQDVTFMETLASGQAPAVAPSIQDIERQAESWASLVPEGPRLRAAIAHQMAQKYRLVYNAIPRIRAALSLDSEPVQQVYQQFYTAPLTSIYTTEISLSERLRWQWTSLSTRLESLPPFWSAFAMTLTETVGAGVLALPIALARVGPLAGVIILIVMGLINMLTITYMAEAVTRNGGVRYRHAFIGTVTRDYLGGMASIITSIGVAAILFLALWAYYLGLSTTLADAVGISPLVWITLIFLVGLYFVTRGSLSSTIASALIIGFTNIVLLLVLVLVALPHVRAENLRYINVPFINGQPFDPAVLGLIFGVVLSAYFGHLSISMIAGVVLKRDPGGRSLIRGSAAGTFGAMLLYCIWVFIVNGAIAPAILAQEHGTAIAPLAATVGPIVHIAGAVFAVLAMGMASIHMSLSLFNLVRERLPHPVQEVMVLLRRHGSLQFEPRRADNLQIGLTYLGYEKGVPYFRFDIQSDGKLRRAEMPIRSQFDALTLLSEQEIAREPNIRLRLEVIEQTHDQVRLRIDTPRKVTLVAAWDTTGLTLVDVLDLPDASQSLVRWLTQQGKPLRTADIAAQLHQDYRQVRKMLDALEAQGFVAQFEGAYEARLAAKRGRHVPDDIWEALADDGEKDADQKAQSAIQAVTTLDRLRALAASKRGSFVICLLPMIAVFLLTVRSLVTGDASFSEPLSFLGTVVVSVFTGLLPPLLLVASRRKGEFAPQAGAGRLGYPVIAGAVFLFYLANIALHGLVIWHNPVQQIGAIVTGVLMAGVTLSLLWRGTFAPRIVVQVQQGEPSSLSIRYNGQPLMAQVQLTYPDSTQSLQVDQYTVADFATLERITFTIPRCADARELKVWALRSTPDGRMEALPGTLELNGGQQAQQYDLRLSGGQVVMPVQGDTFNLTMTLQTQPG